MFSNYPSPITGTPVAALVVVHLAEGELPAAVDDVTADDLLFAEVSVPGESLQTPALIIDALPITVTVGKDGAASICLLYTSDAADE